MLLLQALGLGSQTEWKGPLVTISFKPLVLQMSKLKSGPQKPPPQGVKVM